jgi:ligand-binding sensor domain-containing protein
MKKIFLLKISILIGIIFITVQCTPLEQTVIPSQEANPPVSTLSISTPTFPMPITPTSIFDGKPPDDMTFVDTEASDWTRYDPIRDPGLQQHDFGSITIAPDGNIWMGGKNGIAVFDGNHWTSFFVPSELIPRESAYYIDSIVVDQNKLVWTSGYGSSYRFDGKSWTKELDQKTVSDMEINPQDGTLWLALNDWGGAMKFDGKSWTAYTREDGLISDQVRDVSIDKNGNIWFATDDGISSYDGKAWKNYPLELFCPESSCHLDDRAASIAVDANGSVWVAYPMAGLFHYDSGKWERYENDLIFKDYYPVTNMCFTPDGKLWMGKWSDHSVLLFYFEGGQWRIPRTLNRDGTYDIPAAQINDIACAKDNSIWYVSASMGVGHYIP